jgi:hypothetical protein
MIVLCGGMLLYLLLEPKHRSLLTRPGFWMASVVALLLFMPNLFWNYQYDFISFQHTSEISKLQQSLIHPEHFLEFFLGQFVVFGPITMWLLLYSVKNSFSNPKLRLLLYVALPLLILMSVQAFLAKANLNWASPVYIAGSILVGYALASAKKTRLAMISIGVNLIISVVLYFYSPLQDVMGVEPVKKNNPYYRLVGWRGLMQSSVDATKEYSDLPWLSDSRKLLSYANFYVRHFSGKPIVLYGFNPDNLIKNQYELTRDLRISTSSEFLFVSEHERDLSSCFAESQLIAYLQEPVYSSSTRQLFIYYVNGFNGYGNCKSTNN